MTKTNEIEYYCEHMGSCIYRDRCQSMIVTIRDVPGKVTIEDIHCHCDLKQYEVQFLQYKYKYMEEIR